jgi:hypothetical protein
MDKASAAWAAGLFDGEGYVGCIRGRLRIVVGQKDREVLDRFHAIVGDGNVLGPYFPKGRQIFRWQVGGYSATKRVYEILRPNLGRIKVIQFWNAFDKFKDAR